ncbi:hypothetical protein L2E82_26338 [Cichorium intybus]|uniref:Uncharacterized protein n=1 Tax=Cichorium intybus TaxID=13427 RepID=A0ACB9CQL3_CICIN|nr:hypothetical protein L2E82_26338 [Cichorium intybus]
MSVIASLAAPPQTCFLSSSVIPTPFSFSVKDDTSGADLAQPNPTSSIPAQSRILRSLSHLMFHCNRIAVVEAYMPKTLKM